MVSCEITYHYFIRKWGSNDEKKMMTVNYNYSWYKIKIFFCTFSGDVSLVFGHSDNHIIKQLIKTCNICISCFVYINDKKVK